MGRAIVDKFMEKFISRKMLVMVTSTVLLFVSEFTPEQWLWVAMAYIGSQGAVDIVAKLKSIGN